MSQENFADRLDAAIARKKSCLVVGLDPVPERLPSEVIGETRDAGRSSLGWTAHAATATARYLEGVIEAVAEHAVAVKPNAGFFERFGAVGWESLRRVSEVARDRGLLVICDAKRGDIGSTAAAYAEALLGETPDTVGSVSDSLTLNPYLGQDSVEPFLARVREGGRGVFLLVRTSNPSGKDFQELESGGEPIYIHVARQIVAWSEGYEGESGLNPVGAVVGATAPEQAARIRSEMPKTLFLVPGYGAQGAGAEELRPYFCEGGRGAVVNSSRGILYAFEKSTDGGSWQSAVERAAKEARVDLGRIRTSV